jgi:hypothetical protein
MANSVDRSSSHIFYGWWIVLAAFLNLFFVVGILFYGFPVFYPSMIDSLGFTRAPITTGRKPRGACSGSTGCIRIV